MITKEEAIRAIKRLCMYDGETPQMIWSTDAMDAVRKIPESGGWISVEDRLPKMHEERMPTDDFSDGDMYYMSDPVLVCARGLLSVIVAIAEKDSEGNILWSSFKYGIIEAICWRPLPEAPKGDAQ